MDSKQIAEKVYVGPPNKLGMIGELQQAADLAFEESALYVLSCRDNELTTMEGIAEHLRKLKVGGK